MKKLLLCVLALLPLAAHAGRITMQLSSTEKTHDGKNLCVYSNSIYIFTIIQSRKCASVKTFNTEDSE